MENVNNGFDEANDPNSNNDANNSPKKKTRGSIMLQRIEFLIIAVFLLSFLLWAGSKCSNTQKEIERDLVEKKIRDSIEQALNVELAKPVKQEKEVKPEPEEIIVEQTATSLYVTLENLNLRDRPSLSGKIQARLKLFDKVTFLNEVTDFKQKYTIDDLETNEPWIKVRTEKGVEGWVYGAGVSYYKTKLQTKVSQQ